MTWPEIITTIKDVLLGIAGATTAIVAVKGLNSWRRELKGKTEFEAARNLIRTTYRLRDELKKCRAPFISRSEFPDNYSSGIFSSPQLEAAAYAHVYKNRWKPIEYGFQEFEAHTLEAEALWGEEVRTRTNLLRKCISELHIAIRVVISNKESNGRNFELKKDLAKEMESKVSSSIDGEEEFSKKIESAISEIEDYIRPHLRRD